MPPVSHCLAIFIAEEAFIRPCCSFPVTRRRQQFPKMNEKRSPSQEVVMVGVAVLYYCKQWQSRQLNFVLPSGNYPGYWVWVVLLRENCFSPPELSHQTWRVEKFFSVRWASALKLKRRLKASLKLPRTKSAQPQSLIAFTAAWLFDCLPDSEVWKINDYLSPWK